MRGFLLTLSTFLLLQSWTYSQNIPTDTSAPVVAYWRVGDTKKVQITKSSQKIEGGIQQSFTTNTCEALITVKDSTQEGYTLEWRYTSLGNAHEALATMPELNALLGNITYVYKTDDVGSFQELVNYEEIKKMVNATFTALTKKERDTSLGFRQAMEQARAIFQSRESIEQLIMKEVYLYHTPFGIEYRKRKQEQETALPNFLGGDPWPSTQSYQLTSVKPKEDLARVSITQAIDEKKAADILKAFFTKVAGSSGKQPKEDEFPSYINIHDENIFDVTLSTGWVKRAYVKRTVQIDNVKKIDTIEITIK